MCYSLIIFFVIGIWFGMSYKWLEVQNLKIQLFIQGRDVIELEEMLKEHGQ
jgi:hypothetical protein